jgi:hypothetical protein
MARPLKTPTQIELSVRQHSLGKPECTPEAIQALTRAVIQLARHVDRLSRRVEDLERRYPGGRS